tara:strand:+ start:536 stop:1114 length:579 start_codon:yes stop_codon:yes gene_type:complete
MTKKEDSKVNQDNISELEEVQDNIEQPEEEPDLEEEVEPSPEEEVEPSPEEKISSLEDQMMRLQAEMINTRKSAQNDIARARIFGLESFMKDLLSVIDNLFRNLDFKTEENTIPADGYELILRELENVLGKNGIVLLDPLGDEFDPKLHEAISTSNEKDKGNNIILSVAQKGCTLNDRLIRPALVVVNKIPH